MPLEWIQFPIAEKTFPGGAFHDALSEKRDVWIRDLGDLCAGKQYWASWFDAVDMILNTVVDHERPIFYSWQPFSADATISVTSPLWESIMVSHSAAALHVSLIDHTNPFSAGNAGHYIRASACYARAAAECRRWGNVPAALQSACLESRASTNDVMEVMCETCARMCVAYSAQLKAGGVVGHWSNIYWQLTNCTAPARFMHDGSDSLLWLDFLLLMDIALFESCVGHAAVEQSQGRFIESVALLRKAKEIGYRLPPVLVEERRLRRIDSDLGDYEHVLRHVLRVPLAGEFPFSELMLPPRTSMPRRTLGFP